VGAWLELTGAWTELKPPAAGTGLEEADATWLEETEELDDEDTTLTEAESSGAPEELPAADVLAGWTGAGVEEAAAGLEEDVRETEAVTVAERSDWTSSEAEATAELDDEDTTLTEAESNGAPEELAAADVLVG